MSKKRIRHIRWSRFFILLGIPICMVVGIIFGVYFLIEKKTQDHIKELLAIQCPDSIEQDIFAQIQEKAVSGNGSYEKILMNINEYPEDVLLFLLDDEDRMEFVLNYPNRYEYAKAPKIISASLDKVPTLYQWDLDWGYTKYGEGYLYQTGCAPTCLSMVLSYLLQDETITPYSLAEYSESNHLYIDGVGTDWSFLTRVALDKGVNVEQIYPSESTMQEALSNEKLLICSMLPGDFTQVGHFIVLCGIKDEKVIVHDPNSKKNTKKLWDMDTLINQIQGLWSYS